MIRRRSCCACGRRGLQCRRTRRRVETFGRALSGVADVDRSRDDVLCIVSLRCRRRLQQSAASH